MKIRDSLIDRKVAATISPAALFLRLFTIAFVVSPALLVSWESDNGFRLILPLCWLAPFFWYWLAKRIKLRPSNSAEPVAQGCPISGRAKLLALLVIDGPSEIHSLTGPSVVALDRESGRPVLRELGRPTFGRLSAEAFYLLLLTALFTIGFTWAIERLSEPGFVGLLIALLGCCVVVGTLLQRFGWAAGAYHIEGAVWAAPLIPREGPNRFRAMVSLDDRILVRPDVLEAPYAQYLLAHEEAHLKARSYRLVWLEQFVCIAILVATGLSLPYLDWKGLLILLLLPAQRRLFCHLSYQSELAADAAVAERVGPDTCLAALAILAAEVKPAALPLGQRYSPTIPERIEHLQRFKARPGQS